jgi:hypothetical protein
MDRNAQIASERVRFHHKLKILLDRWRDEMNAKTLTAVSTPYPPRPPTGLQRTRFLETKKSCLLGFACLASTNKSLA